MEQRRGPDLQVYSPATGSTFQTTCTPGEGWIVCDTDDGGIVKFTKNSIDRYTQAQATSYAASHNVSDAGNGSSADSNTDNYSSTDSSGADDYSGNSDDYSSGSSSDGDSPGFCDTHDCIANYPNGQGSTVQCEDGPYSHSGGIQGACSHHGGVG